MPCFIDVYYSVCVCVKLYGRFFWGAVLAENNRPTFRTHYSHTAVRSFVANNLMPTIWTIQLYWRKIRKIHTLSTSFSHKYDILKFNLLPLLRLGSPKRKWLSFVSLYIVRNNGVTLSPLTLLPLYLVYQYSYKTYLPFHRFPDVVEYAYVYGLNNSV